MAESKTVAVVPLNSSNYSTWKIQCKMALIKDGLWGIVNGTETAPTEGNKQRLRHERIKLLRSSCWQLSRVCCM